MRGSAPEQGGDASPDAGVVFQLVDGTRSTSATARGVLAQAAEAADPELAAGILAVRDWRSGYLAPFRDLTRLALERPASTAAIATAGLAAVHERFRFRRGGEDLPLSAVADLATAAPRAADGRLRTVTVVGRQRPGPDVFSLPYRGGRLVAGALDAQLDAWLGDGIAEPSFAAAVRAVMAEPGWLDLRDVTVVVLGAGAQMGPAVSLLGWGAHVVAVDLPSRPLWARLIEVARASPGRLTLPASGPATAHLPQPHSPDAARAGAGLSDADLAGAGLSDAALAGAGLSDAALAGVAGVDLVTRLPEVAAWLTELEGPFTLGNYVYADGAAHVRASVAVDTLTTLLAAARPDLSLAFLATPTDAFAVPPEVVADSARRYQARSPVRRLARLGSGGRLFRPNYPATDQTPGGGGVNDALVTQQGPNYALAKRIQRWRALQARDQGRVVSLNVAPATRTRSVMRNRALAAAYAGAHRFGVEVFDPSTSNTLMAALLVHDLRNPGAAANPDTRLSHPLELLWEGANHGGLWRNAYEPRSVLGLAVALGMVQRGA